MLLRCLLASLCLISPLIAPPAAADYQCSGTEPFWSLKAGPASIIYDDPESGPIAMHAVVPRGAAGASPGYIAVFETKSSDKSEPYTIVVAQDDEGNCSDGMSDTTYPYSVIMIGTTRILRGCCTRP